MQRGPWAEAPRSRRRRRSRTGSAVTGPPFDFSADQDHRVDPVEFLAIRADDELVDDLAAGAGHPLGLTPESGAGFSDDQQVLALLALLRAEIDSVDFPPLLSVEQASKAIVAGRRANRPQRRLMPVATAAALVAVALSGVTLAAGQAQPGDPLWGVATVIDGDRAASVEAAYQVDTALADARTALVQGRVTDARATLARVAPELSRVSDPDQRDALTRTSKNLIETAGQADEGQRVDTDESGHPKDPSRLGRRDPTTTDPRSGTFPGEPVDPSAANRTGAGSRRPSSPADQSSTSPDSSTTVDPRLRRLDPAAPNPTAPNPTAANPTAANPAAPANPAPPKPTAPASPGTNPGGSSAGPTKRRPGGPTTGTPSGGDQGGTGTTDGGTTSGKAGGDKAGGDKPSTKTSGAPATHPSGDRGKDSPSGRPAHPASSDCTPEGGGSTPTRCGNKSSGPVTRMFAGGGGQ